MLTQLARCAIARQSLGHGRARNESEQTDLRTGQGSTTWWMSSFAWCPTAATASCSPWGRWSSRTDSPCCASACSTAMKAWCWSWSCGVRPMPC
ncbi:hypothetical protein [Lysobacter gummosus]|uniref:hypothetical protein n=1 Tax=Lysobacter gummosus TaxID=262324 RepID=UPI00362A4062